MEKADEAAFWEAPLGALPGYGGRRAGDRAFFSMILVLPFQMLFAAVMAMRFRVNVPFAMAACWVSNVFTNVPIGVAQVWLGGWMRERLGLPMPGFMTKVFLKVPEVGEVNAASFLTPFFPASGPATSTFNGLHPKSKFLVIIDACPDTRFILDHCGVPDIASGAISADTLRPIVEHAIDCFGWDRIVWASDWPVCNLTRDLANWTSLLEEILTGSSEDQLTGLYHHNACRIYRLDNSKHNNNHTA